MIFGFIFAVVGAVLLWLIALLPASGCGTFTFSPIDTGWVGSLVNIPAVLTLFALMLAFELAMTAFRVATLVLRYLPI